MKRALLLLIGALSVSAPALAQSKSDHDLALALFKHSDEAYKKGDFRGAADDLEKAYALEPAPVLLYNLGRAYEGLGDAKKAIDAYQRYLKAQPDAEDRGAIEQRIATLGHELELEQRAEQKPAPPPPPPVAPPPAPKSRPIAATPIVVASIGAAGLAAGGVLGALALSTSSSQNAPSTSQLDAQSAHDRASAFATGANVAFIAGAAIAAIGVVSSSTARPLRTAPRARAYPSW